MKKKIVSGLLLGLTLMASTCFAQVVDKVETYKGNELKIPQVEGVKKKAARRINNFLDKEVAGTVREFIDSHGKNGSTSWLITDVVRDDDKYLSLRVVCVWNHKGAAHPTHYVHGLVFDKQTGQRLPLSHFVNMPPADQLESYVKNNIFRLYTRDNQPTTLGKDYHITYISPEYTLDNSDNLDLIYQINELDCYAAGPLNLRLSKEYVDKNGSVLPKG